MHPYDLIRRIISCIIIVINAMGVPLFSVMVGRGPQPKFPYGSSHALGSGYVVLPVGVAIHFKSDFVVWISLRRIRLLFERL